MEMIPILDIASIQESVYPFYSIEREWNHGRLENERAFLMSELLYVTIFRWKHRKTDRVFGHQFQHYSFKNLMNESVDKQKGNA